MICESCQVGADFNSRGNYDKSAELHNYCKGDCCCQHRTDSGYVANDGKPHINLVQSP
jgi:hypothetical protein